MATSGPRASSYGKRTLYAICNFIEFVLKKGSAMDIHKFTLDGLYLVLDVNSGALHIVDKLVYDILDVYTGSNDGEVMEQLAGVYSAAEISDVLQELRDLVDSGRLFSQALDVPPATFGHEPIVKSLCLHIAHDCNLRCKYCFAGTGDFGHNRGFMSPEVGEKAVDFIIAHSGTRQHCEIDFFGGEPLLNMDTVKHVVQYVRRQEAATGKIFKLTLTTNAVLLNAENRQYLNDNGISLVLSLDGRRTVHDKMRPYADGSGSWDTALSNICATVASRQDSNYYLRGTYTAYNLDFAADVLEMADLGFTQLSVEPVVAKDCDYELREEHLPELFRQYELLTEAYLARKQEGRGFEFFHFNLDINHGPCLAKRLSGCGAGHEYYAVTPEGDLYPCHQFVGREQYRLGSVFTDIENTALPKKFRGMHVLNKPACRECWARFFCSGGCHANAQLFNGNIAEPYRLGCELQKKRLECALFIQAKLLAGKQVNGG
jgi:uncharacterized protein